MSDNLPESRRSRPPREFYAETERGLAGPRVAYRPPTGSGGDEIGMDDLWRLLHRQWWVILTVFALVLGATAFHTYRQVPVWQASVLVRVDEGSGSSGAAGLFPQFGGETWLDTEMLVAQTRPILAEVVDRLDLNFQVVDPPEGPRGFLFRQVEFDRTTLPASYQITRLGPDRYRMESLPPDSSLSPREIRAGEAVSIPGGRFALAPDSALRTSGVATPPQRMVVRTLDFDRAVSMVKGGVSVERPKQYATVFRLSYRGPDPALARNTANEAGASYIRQRVDVKKTEARSTAAFLGDQVHEIRSQLEAAETALQEFREGQQVVALASEAQLQVQRLASLEAQRADLTAERDALSNLLVEIQSAGAPDYMRLIAFPSFLGNPTFQGMVQSLVEAEGSRTELRARWTDNHPEVVALDQQIAQVRARLGDIGRNYLRSLNDQIASLNAILVRFGSDLERIPARELQYARLERQTALLANLYSVLQQRLKEAEVVEAVEDPSARLVEPAVLPEAPISPRALTNLMLGAVLGLMLGLGLAVLRQVADRTLRGDDDVEDLLGVSVLTRVPRLPDMSPKAPRSRALVALHGARSLPTEAYRALRSAIFFTDLNGNGKREMVVTSPGARDGKSVTCCNLAIAFAQQGRRTLLVDADLRRSTLHLAFEVEGEPGLTEYLRGEASLEEILRPTKVPSLFLVTAGQTPPNPAELLGSPRLDTLLEEIRDRFEAIVFDSPPILAVADVAVLANKMHGVLLVVRPDRTHARAAQDAMEQLGLVGGRVLGVVVNDTDGGARYGYRYSYYKEYSTDEEKSAHA